MEKTIFKESHTFFDEHMLQAIEEYQKKKMQRENEKQKSDIDLKK